MKRNWIYFGIAMLSLSACGPLGTSPFEEKPPVSQEYSSEGVKWISSQIENGRDQRTYQQGVYSLSTSERLMIRLQKFSDAEAVSRVRLDKENTVEMVLYPVNVSDLAVGASALQVCPIQKSWMMLANWNLAHPFSPAGRWAVPGGEFDSSECVRPELQDPKAEFKGWKFDVTEWFRNYVKGRGVNFGLIVVSTAPLVVYGDRSGQYSPRLRWNE